MPKGRKLYNDLKITDQERIEADRLQVEAWTRKHKVKVLPPGILAQDVSYLFRGKVRGNSI